MDIIGQKISYDFPTNIRFGAGVIQELPAYFKKHGLSKALIVTDPVVSGLPHFQRVVNDLTIKGIDTKIFSGIHRVPQKSDVMAGVATFKETERDVILSMGGGTCSTVARAIALMVHHPGDLFDYEEKKGGVDKITEPIPHFVTVPFTAGSGSEAARSAIISDDGTKEKRLILSKRLLATQVFADPELTLDLPPHVTASTGMDALAHNVEAFLAKGFHPMCDGIALAGISMISSSIEAATKQPDIVSRSKMMIGSLMGAVAYQKGLGVIHSLAHPLSSLLGAHHGTAIATMMPYGLEFNAPGMTTQYKRIALAMDVRIDNVNRLSDYFFELNDTLSLPNHLISYGVKEEHLKPLAAMAINDFCNNTNPREVTEDDYFMMYQSALINAED